ncbi:MAG: hypothetical protein H0U76_01230 [Ktedonobacteraceae bacterium]|nr:hypothetical protein [Ktedonobacteraceae bacterium]MBA3824669.1 hypothetical protein [Ktedonobacterales bacterium]
MTMNHLTSLPPEDEEAQLRRLEERLQQAGAPFREREISTDRFVALLNELAASRRDAPSSFHPQKESPMMPSFVPPPSERSTHPHRSILTPIILTTLLVVLSGVVFTTLNHRGTHNSVPGTSASSSPTIVPGLGTIVPNSVAITPPLTSAPVKNFQEFETHTYQTSQLRVDAQGNLWSEGYNAFATNQEQEAIAKTTPTGVTTLFPIPDTTFAMTPGGTQDYLRKLSPLTIGPDENLWFVRSSFQSDTVTNSLGRMTPTGEFTFFAVPSFGSGLLSSSIDSLTAAPDGNIWFTANVGSTATQPGYGRIGRLTPTGTLTWFSRPPKTQATSIIVGPDGYLWFGSNGAIERMGLNGVITTSYRINGGVNSACVACGANSLIFSGNHTLWFADFAPPSAQPVARIGRLDIANQTVTYYALPGAATPNSFLILFTLAVTSDGGVWFNTQEPGYTDLVHTRQFYHLLPNGTLIHEQLPHNVIVGECIFAPDGKLWFGSATLDSGNKYHFFIAHITP